MKVKQMEWIVKLKVAKIAQLIAELSQQRLSFWATMVKLYGSYAGSDHFEIATLDRIIPRFDPQFQDMAWNKLLEIFYHVVRKTEKLLIFNQNPLEISKSVKTSETSHFI